jgi:phosphonate dehydrogenase
MTARPKVVITHWVHPEVIDLLGESCDVIPNESKETLPRDEVIRRSRSADAIMAFMPDHLDEEFLSVCENLKVIAGALKGYDNIDFEQCSARGIWLTIVPDLLTVPTAELAIGLLLGLIRNMAEGDRFIRSGDFKGWRPQLYGTGIAGNTVGLVGMGELGKAIAKRLVGFDARILYIDKVPLQEDQERTYNLTRRPFGRLLEQSDFVVIAVPLIPDTLNMFSAGTISKMKKGGFLINPARGSVVDEEAVADALEAGHLGGYAADVFEMEDWARSDRPRRINPRLLSMKRRTFFTPHLGSAVDSARKEIALEAARNILQVFEGTRPQGAVNTPRAR